MAVTERFVLSEVEVSRNSNLHQIILLLPYILNKKHSCLDGVFLP